MSNNRIQFNFLGKIQQISELLAYNIFMIFHPFLLVYPQNCCLLMQVPTMTEQPLGEDKPRPITEKEDDNENHQEKKLQIYLRVFREQIVKMRQTGSKKYWTQEQDQFLLNLNPNIVNWKQVSETIVDTNPAICKRRYVRLKEQQEKWPNEVDASICTLFEQEKLDWPQVREIINKNICAVRQLPKFTTNKIKQRYMLYLRPGICRQEWSVDEDVQIIRIIKTNGKEWTKALKTKDPLLNRTDLQVKNRYFGTLKFMEKKVERKVAAILKQKKRE